MELLAELFVGKPQIILAVALTLLALYLLLLVMGWASSHRCRPLLIVALLWGAYAGWEWLVLIKTPEANIRVDLLLIWPLLALASLWALYRAIR